MLCISLALVLVIGMVRLFRFPAYYNACSVRWKPSNLYVDHKYEVNGYQARLCLIRVTVLLSSLEEQDPACQRVQRLLTKLCYIQELAYADESRRTPVNIYAMLNMTYVFWLDYKWVSFDGFHSRIVSRRSETLIMQWVKRAIPNFATINTRNTILPKC